MANPEGVLTLLHELGGSLKLAPTGLAATCGQAQLALNIASGAGMSFGTSAVMTNASSVKARFGVLSSLSLDADGATLTGLPGCKLSLGAGGAKISGLMIQLG